MSERRKSRGHSCKDPEDIYYEIEFDKFDNNIQVSSVENEKNSFDTLDLIKKLKQELQQHPKELKQLFPNRKYSYAQLSVLWGLISSRTGKINKNFVRSYINYEKKLLKSGNSYYVNDEKLKLLKINLIKRFPKDQIQHCLKIIELHKFQEISFYKFTNSLCDNLVNKSDKIEVSDRELSIIMGFFKDRICKIRYNSGNSYKFSIEVLNNTIANLKNILNEKAYKSIELIQKYIEYNPKLKLYSKQQATILNPDAFQIENMIFNPSSFYFFGLLCADGHVRKDYQSKKNSYMVKLKLNRKDKEIIINFAKFMGYPIRRIGDYTEISNNKIAEISVVQFHSKQTCMDLIKVEHFSSGNAEDEKKIPSIIKYLINIARNEIENNMIYELWESYYGRCALSWLMGYYDGDGGRELGYNARIYSSSKKLLNDIKECYSIKNSVSSKKGKNDHYLTIGPEIFKQLLLTYPYSLKRKRNPEYDTHLLNQSIDIYVSQFKWLEINKDSVEKILNKFKHSNLKLMYI